LVQYLRCRKRLRLKSPRVSADGIVQEFIVRPIDTLAASAGRRTGHGPCAIVAYKNNPDDGKHTCVSCPLTPSLIFAATILRLERHLELHRREPHGPPICTRVHEIDMYDPRTVRCTGPSMLLGTTTTNATELRLGSYPYPPQGLGLHAV